SGELIDALSDETSDALVGDSLDELERGLSPRDRKRDPRSYAEALLGLRMTDHAPALEVLDTLAQRRDHLRVPEDLQRLDDALVELPRQNREDGLAATRDRHGALRRPREQGDRA